MVSVESVSLVSAEKALDLVQEVPVVIVAGISAYDPGSQDMLHALAQTPTPTPVVRVEPLFKSSPDLFDFGVGPTIVVYEHGVEVARLSGRRAAWRVLFLLDRWLRPTEH